jgi:hypothetical protein
MTVAELIESLQKMPQGWEVQSRVEYGDPITDVDVDERSQQVVFEYWTNG